VLLMLLKPFQAQYAVIMHWKLATTSFTALMDLKLQHRRSTSSLNQRNYSVTRWSLINGHMNSSGVLEVGLLNPPAVSAAGFFILTPIRIFRWIGFDCARQQFILPGTDYMR